MLTIDVKRPAEIDPSVDLGLVVGVTDGVDESLVSVDPMDDLGPSYDDMSFLQTVRVPVDAFTGANPALNAGSIIEVRLYVNETVDGEIHVDNIEFVAQR